MPAKRTCDGTEGDEGMNVNEEVDDPPMSLSDMSAHASTEAGSEKSQIVRSSFGRSSASSLIAVEIVSLKACCSTC